LAAAGAIFGLCAFARSIRSCHCASGSLAAVTLLFDLHWLPLYLGLIVAQALYVFLSPKSFCT